MKKPWVLSYPLSAQHPPSLILVFAGRTVILLVLSWDGSYYRQDADILWCIVISVGYRMPNQVMSIFSNCPFCDFFLLLTVEWLAWIYTYYYNSNLIWPTITSSGWAHIIGSCDLIPRRNTVHQIKLLLDPMIWAHPLDVIQSIWSSYYCNNIFITYVFLF